MKKNTIIFKDEEDDRHVSAPISQSFPSAYSVQEPSHMSGLSGFPGPAGHASHIAPDPFFRPEAPGASPASYPTVVPDAHTSGLVGDSQPSVPAQSVPVPVDDPRIVASVPPVYSSWGKAAPVPKAQIPESKEVAGAQPVPNSSFSEPTRPSITTSSRSSADVSVPAMPHHAGFNAADPAPSYVEPVSSVASEIRTESPSFVAPVPNRDSATKKGGFQIPKVSIPGIGNATGRNDLYDRGVATLRDLIAPPAIRLAPASIQVGDVVARTLFVMAYPKYLGTNWFSPIINMDAPMDISFFIHPIDTRDIMKDLRKSATQVQSQISIEAQDGKIRDPVLESALENIEELRDSLQQGTEKFFRFGVYMTVYASDEKALTELTQGIESILEAQLVFSKPAVLRMDQGFVATRPLGMDVLDIANNLNTSPLSTTFPFVSSDLSSNEGILYGINRHNNSLILFDRFKMENANMVVFAKSGAGKSYAIKLEVLRSMMFGTNVIIIDPENEYQHLCETVGGTFVGISLSSDAHLNPFDLPRIGKSDDDEGAFRSHVANLIGLLHIMLGSVTPDEDSLLDRAIRETYAIRDITELSDFRSLTSSSFPTMSDLHSVLRNLEGGESLAARLERYTDGVFGGFLNHQTNVLLNRQMVVFNIRDLESELRPIAMYVILQFIWNEIRAEMKQRMIVVDEAWIMMQNEDAAAFMFGIAKRCRKYYAGLTTITQDIGDFMASRYGKPIVTNSSIQLLLRQSPASIDLIAETFYLTDHEKFLLLESGVGEGIFFAGTKHVAVKVIASYSEDQVITTDPRQLLEIEDAKREFDESQGGSTY
ncbi:MAG: DUF87 domain-containing protein [Candidatus Moranbacteria bacterium]|nr:DUF87 domain-containing protein [Candidatus Moranbacteria bacterium]